MCDKENQPKECAVKIAVRERPFTVAEQSQNASNCIEHENKNVNNSYSVPVGYYLSIQSIPHR